MIKKNICKTTNEITVRIPNLTALTKSTTGISSYLSQLHRDQRNQLQYLALLPLHPFTVNCPGSWTCTKYKWKHWNWVCYWSKQCKLSLMSTELGHFYRQWLCPAVGKTRNSICSNAARLHSLQAGRTVDWGSPIFSMLAGLHQRNSCCMGCWLTIWFLASFWTAHDVSSQSSWHESLLCPQTACCKYNYIIKWRKQDAKAHLLIKNLQDWHWNLNLVFKYKVCTNFLTLWRLIHPSSWAMIINLIIDLQFDYSLLRLSGITPHS